MSARPMEERRGRSSQMLRVRAKAARTKRSGRTGCPQGREGARHVGLGIAQAEHRDDREAVENPGGENKERGEFFESAGEGHESGEDALEDERACGSAVAGVYVCGEGEEEAVTAHGVGDAGAGEKRGV